MGRIGSNGLDLAGRQGVDVGNARAGGSAMVVSRRRLARSLVDGPASGRNIIGEPREKLPRSAARARLSVRNASRTPLVLGIVEEADEPGARARDEPCAARRPGTEPPADLDHIARPRGRDSCGRYRPS